jgi:dihydrolipoamide dehydrogenase
MTPALAHTASAEGMHAVEVIAGKKPPVINYNANPNAIYCYPEIASVGMTEKKLKDKGTEYKVAKFPFAPLAKAKIEGTTDGYVKILYGAKYREILGVHIVHAKATELIAEFVLGQILETTIDEIGMAIHPHPTLSETIMEAAHVAHGGGIHL